MPISLLCSFSKSNICYYAVGDDVIQAKSHKIYGTDEAYTVCTEHHKTNSQLCRINT